jgi:exonuclease III
MRLLSWNCRGLGNPCIVLELLLLIKEQGPSVLFLFETRLDSLGVEWLHVKLKFGGAFCVPRVRTGGGLAMLWTDKAKVGVNTYSKNHIDAFVLDTVTQKEFRVTGFYGNAETHRRRESWALLKHLSSLSSLPWVCMGDFNEVLDYWEVKGRRARPLWQIQDFRDAVAHCELHDLGFEGNQFTWRNKRSSDDFVTGRLNRMLGTSSWISDFEGAVVSHLAVQNSDHCPLLLTIPTPQAITKKKKLFRFEAMWVKDEQCRGVIEQAWRETVEGGSPMFKVVEKLKCCRASLILWSKERFGSIAASIKAKRLLLQNLINTTPSGHSDRIMEVQAKLNVLLLKEEIYW